MTMTHSEPPDGHADAPAGPEVEVLEQFRRSPHPYLRHRDDIRSTQPTSARTSRNASRIRTPLRASECALDSDEDGRKRRKRASQSPSESGTEADDEGYGLVKALPAPPLRPRKGLRDQHGSGNDGAASPLLTPSQVDDEGRAYAKVYFEEKREGSVRGETSPTDEEAKAARQKYLKRRRNELVRRTSETVLLAGISILAVRGCGCWDKLLEWHRVELGTHAMVMAVALGVYPLRLLYYSRRRNPPSNLRFRQQIRIPAAFDPAPILYPAIVPVLISISLFATYQKPLLPNILLGLAALPPQLIPFGSSTLGYSSVHWLVSILPLIASENTDIPSRLSALTPYKLKLPPPDKGLDPELLVILFPFHQALLPPLYYLTTTSLLPTELHLLSIALINMLLFSDSPQMGILKTLTWLGGIGLFVLCGKVLKWGVALARIPRWRFRRVGQIVQAQQSFLQVLNETLRSKREQHAAGSDSDADDNPLLRQNSLKQTKSLKVGPVRSSTYMGNDQELQPSTNGKPVQNGKPSESSIPAQKRRNTLPNLAAEDHTSTHRYSHRKRSKSIAQSYLSLTPTQATIRKWVYAAYFYLVVVVMILGPIRHIIGTHALHSHEPFGWAISYLFGNIQRLRWEVFNWDLDFWIPLPPILDSSAPPHPLAPAEHIRKLLLGEATTRLLLSSYCLLTIALGLLSVLSLSAIVEVDTRRKVFHGTMVAMLLPTIYIDPCFVALALALVLAIFLLLDLIRASQLPPLSKPIARFLTPYVDGRDLRGPVVVSHIFLLIGCAIPLWLSLAGTPRTGDPPWAAWDVAARDVSMVAGVVCVGMGDAAASLIGRRYGRRKWPWGGGKSLEGSLAFAVAVTIGLLFGKAWLYVGWGDGSVRPQTWVRDALWVTGKAALCAAGASLNEAVLTGGNDNVVVPVVLWVLVRGVGL
ncbi:hypothetical protein P153DRAFT_372595 [Dothidotthia symphoricarpi CBS 119687]|uniref:dolichol kinase n=1 Tax=Dothidotthia symphoricarpi CBS 119687 TaxID=1392245 RepID=A0A6A6ASI5_9PLEO|nr:uncharacterized protein P153DRAFT_372595 [Dothidotthia symphoricarpi CBS 119687]KAF2134128.1 hypothetical protein P153DRAFT_372595 [Dothidotthia symphoricarpi CBS 119687]